MKAAMIFANKTNLLFLIAALIFFGLAAVGGGRAYSPVPFWDMWPGYLEFFTKISDGEWSAWWAQHNEHRIVLARVFFWLDLSLLGGQGWFLVLVNYGLLMLVCVLIFFVWKEVEPDIDKTWLGYFLMAWLFFWTQNENLVWGFQSQFILAQLLPLASFYFLHLSCHGQRLKSRFFALSIVTGIMSIGSMANGVLTLPLMLVFALIVRMEWRKTLWIGVVATICISLYFYEYKATEGHGSLGQTIFTNPLGLLHYVAIYVGGPLSLGNKSNGLWTATVAGIFLVFTSMYFAWRVLSTNRQDSLQVALLMFILFVGGTALGTGGGRLIFGVDQALASRYLTPSLMAWAAFFMLCYINFLTVKNWANKKLWIALLGLLVLMLPQQLRAVKSKTEILYERSIAALALELGIKDQEQIKHVFISADWTLNIAEQPVERNYTIFGMDPYKDLRQQVGATANGNSAGLKACDAHLDSVEFVKNDPRFIKIRGWLWSEGGGGKTDLLEISDAHHQIKGFGLSGQYRPDLVKKFNQNAAGSGFKAYVLNDRQGDDLIIKSANFNCQFAVKIPVLVFGIIDNKDFQVKPTVSLAAVENGNTWTGRDFFKSEFEHMNVLGSHIDSDAHIGSITLKMNRGDRLYYRSGPVSNRQTLEILGSSIKPMVLPISLEWQLLEFSSRDLPEVFKVKFTDAGDAWGEWSAIAVKNSKN
jgi:hypothetical protein